MKRSYSMRALALAILLLGTSTARADLISWGYDWTPTPSSVTAGTGGVKLISDGIHFAVNTTNIVAANLQVMSSADGNSPDTFTSSGGKYTLKVDLFDVASGTPGSLTFTGQLQGSFSLDNANVSNTFLAPATQSILLGHTLFTVTLNAYTPPGPPSQGNLGSMGATVTVQNVPEPSSVALATFGFTLAGFAGWRRRRSAALTR